MSALALSVAIAACSVRPNIVVFNNTVAPILITLDDEKLEIAPGQSGKFIWRELMLAEIEGRQAAHLPIGHLPPEYVETGIFRASIRVQVEPGGKLYVVRPGVAFPLRTPFPQPDGWPVAIDAGTASLTEPVQPTRAAELNGTREPAGSGPRG